MNARRLAAALALALAACRREPRATHAADAAPCHCRHDAAPRALSPPPDTSVFHLGGAWRDPLDRPFELASLRGGPAVVLMFYGTCRSVCPILLGDVKRLEAALDPAARAHTRFVLVTLDPAADTPARLRSLAAERGMDASRWALLRGDDDDIRALATVLGVQYSRVGPGEFTHSNVLTVLDAEGRVARQLEGLRQPVEPTARAIEALAR